MLFRIGLLCIVMIFVDTTSAFFASKCQTPNGDKSHCISIYHCKILRNVLNTTDSNQLRFLKASQCAGHDQNPYVCCGAYNNYQEDITPMKSKIPRDTLLRTDEVVHLNRSTCGKQTADRILNGERTALDEFPWLVQIHYRRQNGSVRFGCAGTLISSRYVLTAAHCVSGPVQSRYGSLINLVLGDWDMNTEPDCVSQLGFEVCADPSITVGIEEVTTHSGFKYNGTNMRTEDDIALIRMAIEVPLSNFIMPICLPTEGDVSDVGNVLTVAGWGRTESARVNPRKLKLRIPIMAHSECSTLFANRGFNISSNNQMCAGGEEGKDACSGDSGGPLMTTIKNDSSQWYIEGIVSFGARCGTEGWPGIYTRVSAYIDWIEENMKS